MSGSRALQRMSSPGFGGMGQFGGAFLLINALSGKIYELINEASRVVTKGYETGGILGLARSDELRTLLRRYLWLLSLVFAYERVRWLWSFLNGFKALTKCKQPSWLFLLIRSLTDDTERFLYFRPVH